MDDAKTRTRVRRVLWLRKHKVGIQIIGTFLGGVSPLIAANLTLWILEIIYPFGADTFLRMCFIGPLSVLLIVPLAALGYTICKSVASQRMPYGYCQFCGYNLQNYTVPRCPECGNATVSEY